MSDAIEKAVRKPTHEAHWSASLFEEGMGMVIIARFKAGGTVVENSVFLVDMYCLGVKGADHKVESREAYNSMLQSDEMQGMRLAPVDPIHARKLVDQAAAYAERLGFAKPREYKKAARVLGGIDASQCDREFTFGREGKPCYIQGPNDSPYDALHIVLQLARRLGEDNFDYILVDEDGVEVEDILEPEGEDEPGERPQNP